MKKVFGAVGHGGNDKGAIGNGLKESELNLKQALRFEYHMKRHGVNVLLSRYKEENDDLNEEVRECNTFNPDLGIAFHTNAGGGTGFEVFHYQGTGTSYKLATKINNEIVAAKLKSRGVKCRLNSSGGQYYGFLRNTTAPTVITEMAFIDNWEDIKNFDEDYEIEKYAICIAKATLKILGITWKEDVVAPPTNKEIYRVRKSWADAASQKGAFKDLENAKKCADENAGYSVFDSKSNKVYGGKVITIGSKVKIIGTHYATGQAISDWAKKQIHTVAEIKGDRALLKEITSWCFIKDLI